jgi:hypothetical protein
MAIEEDKVLNLPAIHICRVHVVRFIFDSVARLYVRNKNLALELWNSWTSAFLRSKDHYSIHRRFTDVIVIAGTKSLTVEVKNRVNNISRRTERSGKP